jgi:hypothetical protein
MPAPTHSEDARYAFGISHHDLEELITMLADQVKCRLWIEQLKCAQIENAQAV